MAVPFFGFGDPIPFGTERNRHFHFKVSTAAGTSPSAQDHEIACSQTRATFTSTLQNCSMRGKVTRCFFVIWSRHVTSTKKHSERLKTNRSGSPPPEFPVSFRFSKIGR